jgi:pimeloyl-ACP methyl ester carboxylesterase
VEPETRYARSDELHIAYQVVGAGPRDLVLVPPFVSHVEHYWQDPLVSRFLGRLAAFSQLILFDKRGTGLSDRVPPTGCRPWSSGWTTCGRCWMPPGRRGRRCSGRRRAAR